MELRRVEYQDRGLPPELPHASSTDDVEGFITLLHDQLGDVFDHKAFLLQQPKILNEFTKKQSIQTYHFSIGLDTGIGTLMNHYHHLMIHQALLKD